MIAATDELSRQTRRVVGAAVALVAALALSHPPQASAQDVEIQPEYRLDPPAAPDLSPPELRDEEAPSREEVEKALKEALEGQGAGDAAEDDSADGEVALAPELDPDSPEAVEADFAELKSEDEGVWRAAQERIARRWSRSGSDSMDLLLKRGRDALERENWDRAIRHFTDLVTLAPDFAEGWNARATAHFQADDYGAALSDIAAALALEPRHFGALAGLGRILDELGEVDAAYAAYRRALDLHPHLEGPKEAVERLSPEVEGRGA